MAMICKRAQMERNKARNWYWWLWLSPLLTIPTLVFIALATYFLLDFNELAAAMLAAFVSTAWHLFLLIPINNKESNFVRWHGKQMLALAGLQIITLFSIILTAVGEDLIIIALATGLAWFFGTLFGQLQAAKGDCSLMRWYGHENELLTLASEKETNLASGLDPDAMVDIIRFSRDPEERRNVLKELDRLGMVEVLGDSPISLPSPATIQEAPKEKKSKTNRWVAFGVLAIIIIGMIIVNNSMESQRATYIARNPTNTQHPKPTATTRSIEADEAIYSQWPVVRYDTFDSSTGWEIGPYNFPFARGSHKVTNGKLQWSSTAKSDFIAWYFPEPVINASDFYVSVEAEQVNGVSDAKYGVVFRVNQGDYYIFRILENHFSARLYFDDEWITLIPLTRSSAIKKAEPNKISVWAEGSHFIFYINDQYVGEVEDDHLPNGSMGLGISMSDAGDKAVFEFDNFELRISNADAETQNKLDALDSISQGVYLAIEGDIEGALENFAAGQALDPELEIFAEDWNAICWFGSLWGYAADVMDACEKAVALDPDSGGIRDSRGLARALLGDYEGAIEDFEFFLEQYKKKGWCDDDCLRREDWIDALETGINPFDAQLLEDLKNE